MLKEGSRFRCAWLCAPTTASAGDDFSDVHYVLILFVILAEVLVLGLRVVFKDLFSF